MTLSDTATMMLSENYQDRFVAEYIQLMDRYTRLYNLLVKWDAGTLNFEPSCPRRIYDLQLDAMRSYLTILEARAKMENIDIDVYEPTGSGTKQPQKQSNQLTGPMFDRLVTKVVEQFDKSAQDLVLIEEMSELTKELMKSRRGESNFYDRVEELSHVLVSLHVYATISKIGQADIESAIIKKLQKYGWVSEK